jgi:hypothetical protein
MHKTLIALALLAASSAFAQHVHPAQANGYAGLQTREIKALSSEQIADLRDGRGMGASLPAELNGVPGPLHVLQLASQLKITPQQQQSLERLTADMKSSAQQLGAQVIAAEAQLDAAFKSGAADEKTILDSTARIAALQGQLRAVHLMAHLKTKGLLTQDQVLAYKVARGYSDGPVEHKHLH